MKKPSKASRIRALYAQGKTCREIADIVGCRVEYARVAAQQRGVKSVDGYTSRSEATYLCRKYGTETVAEARRIRSRERYADPVLYERHMAAVDAYRVRQKSLAKDKNRSIA